MKNQTVLQNRMQVTKDKEQLPTSPRPVGGRHGVPMGHAEFGAVARRVE